MSQHKARYDVCTQVIRNMPHVVFIACAHVLGLAHICATTSPLRTALFDWHEASWPGVRCAEARMRLCVTQACVLCAYRSARCRSCGVQFSEAYYSSYSCTMTRCAGLLSTVADFAGRLTLGGQSLYFSL